MNTQNTENSRPQDTQSTTHQTLYEHINVNQSGYLKVDSTHELYWEESGNRSGIPAVFLHGGPGGGSSPISRRFFNPKHYRIILFDQRGSGKSKPVGELKENSTGHLIQDMEQLRKSLDINKWLIFGGSWGSTLGLAYGQSYPDRCLGFILRGVFLFSKPEVNWFLYGMETFFPEAYKKFRRLVQNDQGNNILEQYYIRLTSASSKTQYEAAASWCHYENSCAYLIPPAMDYIKHSQISAQLLAMARIEAYYMKNNGFLKDGQILNNLYLLEKHWGTIIQGRYDIICPIITANRVAQSWPHAQYNIIPGAGHSSMEDGIRSALVKATNSFANQ